MRLAGSAAASRCSSPAASASASRSPARSSTDPQVLLLDEPLGALDLKLRQEMQVFLKALQQELGITFVYVTHDQEEALAMSDRIAVFNQGRVEQVGSPAEVYERPATEFVAGFVGVSNMLERDGRRFTIRPEKIRHAGRRERRTGSTPRRASSRGRLRRRRSRGTVVDLDAGRRRSSSSGRTSSRRPSRRSTEQGRAVTLAWLPSDAFTIDDPHRRRRR